jgi:serine/threonine protein kinase
MARMVGRYELLSPLGKGGMAEVFLARRRGPGGVEKRLVVKRIRRERARDPRFLKLFVQEARLSMSLAHKNIVPMFDFGRAGDELFLVMEYVDGHDLGAVLERAKHRGTAMAPVLAAYVAMEACQALDYAHRSDHSLVHRDVTPRNIMLSLSGELKLMDFGVATTETDLGGAGKVRGTPAYMSPEQARGESVDGRADVFSLGLVLWEILSGRRAYDTTDSKALLESARVGDVPELPAGVPEALGNVVKRATKVDRDNRFAGARAMQIALDNYLVDTRAADENRRPSALELADWVTELFAGDAPSTGETSDLPSPQGSVVTFLEDGLDQVERALTLAPGQSTMRSIAETVMEPETIAAAKTSAGNEDEPSADSEPEGLEERRRPRAHPRALWAAGALFLIAGGAVAVSMSGMLSSSGPADEPEPGAKTAMTAIDAAPAAPLVVPADATVTAVAPTAVPPDAAPARRGHVARAKADARSKAPPVEPGTVKVRSQPWAEVTVVGRDEHCPDTNPCTLTLPPGTYTLRLHNPPSNLGMEVPVTVTSGETTVIRRTLTRPL